ncbi:MAG TPA: hypothetical protein ENI33_09205 [Thermoplasmatales archaeon]|nr:hypothetical protein [Thermoplasmatales archaeon]
MKSIHIKLLSLFLFAILLFSYLPESKPLQNKKGVWPPSHIKVKFLPRVNIVHLEDADIDTEYNFLASIPMTVFHYNGTVYQSLLIPDTISMPVEYIMEDWKTYLDEWGGVRHINFIGDVPEYKKIQFKNFYDVEWQNVTNITGNSFEVADLIAIHDWENSSRAIIAPYKQILSDDDIESISNAAVIASLYNAPLLFTSPSLMGQNTTNVLEELGVNSVVMVEIGDVINDTVDSQLASMGIAVEASLTTENSIISYIMNLTNQSMLCAIIYNWQNLPASLYGARYGGYVLFLPDNIASLSNNVEEMLKNLKMLNKKVTEPYKLPDEVRYGEQTIANDFYNWLDGLGGNDPDDLEIVVTFNTATYYDPSNGFSVTFERALNGDPSDLTANGAITGRMPLNFTGNIALVNRGGTYRATIFANPRPNHTTLCMNAYEVQHTVNAGSPVVDSWGTNHIVNEIFGWPYRGWCAENNYFPWQDIFNNTPNLSPILPPGPGDGPDCDPSIFASFIGKGYEAHFHSGAYAGTGSHPAQPDVPNIGFVADVENGSTYLYFSCHGGGTGIAIREYDNGIAQDYNGEAWGSPYWPDDDGRTYDGSAGGYYTQTDLDNDLGNTHSLLIGYNACSMANGEMNEVLLEHGGIMSIGSYTSVSFTGSGWWWNLFTYLITHENYSFGEAATYATARTAPLYAPNTGQRGTDSSLYYVCYGDPMVKFVKPEWTSPEPEMLNIFYGGHKPDGFTVSISFNLSLSKGWNLITLPVENNYTASSLYADIPGCNIILSWNASIADFDLYVPGSPNDFVIENGTGYLIGVENDTFLNITGMPIESVNVPLYIGWNMLGWFNSTPTNASSLLNSIPGCNIVLKWNNSKEDFDLYAPGVPNNFIIKQGDGFLIAVNQESIWHG